MQAIEIMVKEHENIRRMLKVIRKLSYQVMIQGNYDLEDIPKVIDFVRTYADKLHHGKEEDILFKAMSEKIERLAKSGAITGMYIEHDNGRLYMANLEKAIEKFKQGHDEARLDIIANAISYAELLDRHIEKENTAMYKFAENMLDDSTKAYVDEESKKVDIKMEEYGIQKKYLDILDEFEKKYL